MLAFVLKPQAKSRDCMHAHVVQNPQSPFHSLTISSTPLKIYLASSQQERKVGSETQEMLAGNAMKLFPCFAFYPNAHIFHDSEPVVSLIHSSSSHMPHLL